MRAAFECRFLKSLNLLVEERLLPATGAALTLYYLFHLKHAEENNLQLNKSALINKPPSALGSLTRRRYLLELLIKRNVICVRPGIKKSEKFCELSQATRDVLARCS